jgi:hypothetical protein
LCIQFYFFYFCLYIHSHIFVSNLCSGANLKCNKSQKKNYCSRWTEPRKPELNLFWPLKKWNNFLSLKRMHTHTHMAFNGSINFVFLHVWTNKILRKLFYAVIVMVIKCPPVVFARGDFHFFISA